MVTVQEKKQTNKKKPGLVLKVFAYLFGLRWRYKHDLSQSGNSLRKNKNKKQHQATKRKPKQQQQNDIWNLPVINSKCDLSSIELLFPEGL